MKYNLLNIVFVLIILLIGCSKQQEGKKYLARVGDKVLTKNEFEEFLKYSGSSKSNRTELVRRWIEDEILYQESVENELTENDNFRFLSGMNEKKLAGALLIKKFFDERELIISDSELVGYFEDNKNDFRFYDDLFTYNLAAFSDENSAIKFRQKLVGEKIKWSDNFDENEECIDYKLNKLSAKHDIYPVQILRSLNKLLPGEISIVIKTEPERYNIVQLLYKIEKGGIPDFHSVKDLVKLRLKTIRQKEMYNEYYKYLYSKYNVEINKDF